MQLPATGGPSTPMLGTAFAAIAISRYGGQIRAKEKATGTIPVAVRYDPFQVYRSMPFSRTIFTLSILTRKGNLLLT